MGNIIRTKTPLKIVRVEATSEQKRYTAACITDGDDFSWWIADNETQPQVVTLELDKSEKVFASRIRFQKDSSTYTHKVETSIDGKIGNFCMNVSVRGGILSRCRSVRN